jgi:hypothetical protein
MRKNVKAQYGVLFTLLLFFVLLAPLFARGKQEEQKREPQYSEFVLCVTTFDVSALPPGQQPLGYILQREFARDMGQIHHRLRVEAELLRYEDVAWTAEKRKAAAMLAVKRGERDALLFQGYPDWKYKKELKRINKELETLEKEYKKALEEKPVIEEKPLFKLIAENTAAAPNFPQPPRAGNEEAFLRDNNADAFLTGKFRLLYGRIYAEFRIYARASSYVYEDSLIFSFEDLNSAANEIKQRFLVSLTNTDLIRMVLYSNPEDARIEVNGRFVKSGETVELPSGPVTLKINADEHQGVSRELELEGGEQEFAFTLKPFTQETLGVTFSGSNSLLYLGAMLVKKNPPAVVKEEAVETADEEITEEQKVTAKVTTTDEGDETEIPERFPAGFFPLSIPVEQYRYIRVDTEDGLTGEAIVKGINDAGSSDAPRLITLKPRKLPGKDEKPVEKVRRKFYGAFGRFWVALPLALLSSGVAQSYANSYYLSGKQEAYNNANASYYVSVGAWAVTGVFIAESLIRLGIYVHTATKESIPYEK